MGSRVREASELALSVNVCAPPKSLHTEQVLPEAGLQPVRPEWDSGPAGSWG